MSGFKFVHSFGGGAHNGLGQDIYSIFGGKNA